MQAKHNFNSIDLARIKELEEFDSDGDGTFLDSILNLYLQESPQIISKISLHLSAGKIQEVQRAAHSLKSSSANIGAAILAGFCKDLELSTMPLGDFTEANLKLLFEKIQNEFSNCEKEIKKLIRVQAKS